MERKIYKSREDRDKLQDMDMCIMRLLSLRPIGGIVIIPWTCCFNYMNRWVQDSRDDAKKKD